MNTPHTPESKWSLDTMTGAVSRHGEFSGTKITSTFGTAHELIGDANMIPTLLSQRNELREVLIELNNHAMQYGGVPASATLLWNRVKALIESTES